MAIFFESEKYRAYGLKQLGVVLVTPFASIFYQILLGERLINNDYDLVRFLITCFLFLLGVILINSGREILEDLDRRKEKYD